MGVGVNELTVHVDVAMSAGEAIDVCVVVVLVVMVMFVGVLHGQVPMPMLVHQCNESATPAAARVIAITCTESMPSLSTTHDNTTLRNGAECGEDQP